MTTTLRTYPDLSAHCLKERKDLSYRLWLLLRQHCPGGRGWLKVADVYALSCGTKRQTKRWLRQGQGTFWHRYGDRLYLHGLAKVSAALEVKNYKRPVAIPTEDLENLRLFRAMLYKSWFTGRPKTISQSLLAQVFGRRPKTLYSWGLLSGLGVHHNIVWSKLDKDKLHRHPPGVMAALGIKDITEEVHSDHHVTHWLECWQSYPYKEGWQYRKGKKPALVRQFVNTYYSDLSAGPKTRLQREACKAVKGSRRRASHSLDDNPTRPPAKSRFLIPWVDLTDDPEMNKARLAARKERLQRSMQKNGFAIVQGPAWHHDARTWELCLA